MLGLLAAATMTLSTDSLRSGFQDVPQADRMRMYWRIFGPAWTKPEIDRELAEAKRVGLGGLMAYFMYPVTLEGNQRFGSPEFLDTFGYAAQKAKSLGLKFGVSGSTGWPYGGPTVSLADAAKKIRVDKVGVALKEGERIVYANGDKVFVAGPCGMRIKRAANGAEGWAVSHFDTPALKRYLKSMMEPMASSVGSIFCDSLEVYGSNWCDDLPAQFRKRRGYDLLPSLPALFDAKAEAHQAVVFDYWRTLMELTEERFTKPLGEWCRAHRIQLEMEAYGTPPNPSTAARYIDIPTGEHYEWKGFSVQKYVASTANLCGKPLVGSEAWTWAGIPNRMADSLSDLKLVSDMAFLAGMNDVTGVDFPYSPPSAGTPGWLPYYGPWMNENNPQWKFFSAFVGYVNRCQYMLRQGKPVRDVAVYTPTEDALADGAPDQMLLDFAVRDRLATGHPTSEFGLQNALVHQSDLLHGLIRMGFDYDGIDFFAMERLASVRDGKLVAGDGRYSALILPNLESMDLPALEKVVAFCRAGGFVVATQRIPNHPAGRSTLAQDKRFQQLIQELFGEEGQLQNVGKGFSALVKDDADAAQLLYSYLPMDVTIESGVATVGVVHRRTATSDIYYMINVGAEERMVNLSFADRDSACEEWDAVAGSTRGSDLTISDDRSQWTGILPARGSKFIVFDRTRKVQRRAAGGTPDVAQIQPIEIGGTWELKFDGPDAPRPAILQSPLASWTGLPGADHFSGLGTYSASFDLTDTQNLWLAFTDVREAAEVKVNGQVAGVLWCPPWKLPIDKFLRKGRNTIEITVANLPVNRFLGLPDIDLGPLRAKYGNRFPAPEEKRLMKEPAPSGIIGKVWLAPFGVR